MDTTKVVTIRSFNTYNEAILCKTLLESSGVDCMLMNETISNVLAFQSELTQIYVAVREEDVAKAEEALSAGFDHEEFDTESVKRRKKP